MLLIAHKYIFSPTRMHCAFTLAKKKNSRITYDSAQLFVVKQSQKRGMNSSDRLHQIIQLPTNLPPYLQDCNADKIATISSSKSSSACIPSRIAIGSADSLPSCIYAISIVFRLQTNFCSWSPNSMRRTHNLCG